MEEQKTANRDYMKIVEMNDNMNLFKMFLSENHSDLECKNFCFEMLDRCPELKKQIQLQDSDKCTVSTVRKLSIFYDRIIEQTYCSSGIEKNLKPKKNLVKETENFVKRKISDLKDGYYKLLIWIVAIGLYISTFYIENQSLNSLALAIATGLFSSLVFEILIKKQKEYKEKKGKQINWIVAKCKILKEDFAETKENYLADENDQMIFYDFIMSYKRLYEYVHYLKSQIDFKIIPLQVDLKAFECYYQEKIEKEIQKCDDNFSDLKNIYLENKGNYKEIILKPYALAIELIDNLIGLYVVDFGFLKQKEEGKNG